MTDSPRPEAAVAQPVPGDVGEARSVRRDALDGLRGIVIVSVVLNHAGGILWPRGGVYDVPWLRGLLGGGAVITFFVVGAFIVTANLLREEGQSRLDPARFYARRLVRLYAQLVPFCALLVALYLWDPTWPGTARGAVENSVRVLTFTQNEHVRTDLFSSVPEVGHLWFLSVQQQVYLVLPLFVLIFARRRQLGALVLALAIAAVYVNRQYVLGERGWVIASVLTETRSDGLLWGVLLALVLGWLSPRWRWDRILWVSLLALAVLKLGLSEVPGPNAYLQEWSLAFTFASGVVVVSLWRLSSPTRTSRALSWRPLARLGKASLAIFVWHYPVIVIVSRHTSEWDWWTRTLLAFGTLAVIVVVAERLLETPVRRLLGAHPFFRIPATDGARDASR